MSFGIREIKAASVVLAALAVSGCGGCESPSSSGSAPPSASTPPSPPSSSAPAASVAPSGSTENRQATTELDVSGAATEHLTLKGLQVGQLEPEGIRFTFSQSNEAPVNTPERRTFSIQTGAFALPGQTIYPRSILLVDSLIYIGQCKLTVKTMGPPRSTDHVRWVEGVFDCEKMHPEKSDKVVTVTNGHFEGPFVDNNAK
jgi:hypothetical protein